jgi:hypothetical protein
MESIMQKSRNTWWSTRSPIHFAIAIAIVAPLAGALAEPTPRVRPIAYTGQFVPAQGVTIQSVTFNPNSMPQGTAAFYARTSGPGNPDSLWSGDPSGVSLVVRNGDPAPGFPGTVFSTSVFNDYTIIPIGEIAFVASWMGPASFGYGVWLAGDAGLTAIAWRDGPASSEPGDVFTSGEMLISPGFDNSVLIYANATGGNGYWRYRDNQLQPLIRVGDAPDGLEPGVSIAEFFPYPAQHDYQKITVQGDFVTSSRLAGPGMPPGTGSAMWRVSGDGTVSLVARSGTPLPGTPPGATFGPSHIEADHFGHVVVLGAYRSGDVYRECLWTGTPGALSIAVRPGDPAPDTEPGSTLSFTSAWLYDGDDILIFLASIAGPNVPPSQNYGLWLRHAGSAELLARKGRPLPFVPTGAYVNGFSLPDQPIAWVSPAGRIAFAGTMAGAGITSANSGAIWAVDRVGRVRRMIRYGDTVEVAPGDVRTIFSLRSYWISDSGHVLARVSLTGGAALISAETDCPRAACDFADVVGNDCRVTLDDLAAVLTDFGAEGPFLAGDANLDRAVNLADLATVLAAFGQDCNE